MTVGLQPDDEGRGDRVGSPSDQLSVGCGCALGVGATEGTVDLDGAASGVAGSSRSCVTVGCADAVVAASSADREGSAVSAELSGPSSTSTGWVGCTNVSAEVFSGLGVAALLPIGVWPPMSAATGTEIATRMPLA